MHLELAVAASLGLEPATGRKNLDLVLGCVIDGTSHAVWDERLSNPFDLHAANDAIMPQMLSSVASESFGQPALLAGIILVISCSS